MVIQILIMYQIHLVIYIWLPWYVQNVLMKVMYVCGVISLKIENLYKHNTLIYIMSILVIVESPAKCKKIEQYLGSSYKCMASYGHFRNCKSLKNIDYNSKLQFIL